MQAPDVIFADERASERASEDVDWDERASAPELWPIGVTDALWIVAGLAAARILLYLA